MVVIACHPCAGPREWFLSHGVSIGVILIAAFVVLALAHFAVRRMQRRLEGAESETQELNLQRSATLTQALSYVIRILVWTMTILLLLGQFDINLGPLLAGAGIAGVALGFGAQSLVKDFLSGFFILLENQYGVGAGITVNVSGQIVSGKVEGVSLRTTEIRSFDGTLHVIPNGNILYAGNRSKGWARAIVDVRVGLDEDLDRARETLEELFEELKAEEAFQGAFFSGPQVLGVERVGDHDVVLRATAEVRPTRKGDLERELRVRIKRRFDERGIRAPIAPATRSDGGSTPGS
jgi:small-conductance mechanosensitive channel